MGRDRMSSRKGRRCDLRLEWGLGVSTRASPMAMEDAGEALLSSD